MPTPTKKGYKQLDLASVRQHFAKFYLGKLSFRKFCKNEGLDEQRTSLSRLAGKIELLEMKKLKRPWFVVDILLADEFKKRQDARKSNVEKLHEDCCVLTKDEEMTIVETCRFLSRCGLDIDRDTCLEMVNDVLKVRIEEKEFEAVSRGVVNRLIARNKELLGMFSGNALDQARARQANVDVRDAMFVKLDLYIKFLHAQGKVPWKCWADVPPECISNMDEVATNCHAHRKKLIGNSYNLGRLFQELCGDSKMPFHITLCITTQPTGKLLYV